MRKSIKFTEVPPATIAFNMAYEERVLRLDEDGRPEPDAYECFERFWGQVERELIAPAKEKNYLLGVKEGRRIQREVCNTRALSLIAMVLGVASIILRLGARFGWF